MRETEKKKMSYDRNSEILKKKQNEKDEVSSSEATVASPRRLLKCQGNGRPRTRSGDGAPVIKGGDVG